MRKLTPENRHEWNNEWYDTESSGGRFERHEALFRNWITRDGSSGPSGKGGFRAESGRYHLYVSMACPWAHRTLMYRQLKDLQEHISVSYTRAFMGPESWSFEPPQGRLFRHTDDDDFYVDYLYELYRLVDPEYSGRATVPLLWDKQDQTIVSNESAEIIRMFNSAFNELTGNADDFYPEESRQEIDELNEWIYPTLNNGVYRAGFATSQAAYEEAVEDVFNTLEQLEQRLESRRYLCGAYLTEADIRLFPTLVRFDSVYTGHFKCSLKRLVDFPALWAYTRDIYQLPGIADTVDIEFNKVHYYGSHDTINPTGIIPVGPELDFLQPHDRDSI